MKENLASEDRDFDRMVEEEALIETTMELVSEILEEDGITRTELASRLGKSKGYVSQVLSGERNMTLRTLAQVLFALETRAKIGAEPLSRERSYRVGSGRWNSVENPTRLNSWLVVKHDCSVRSKSSDVNLMSIWSEKGLLMPEDSPDGRVSLADRSESSKYRKVLSHVG